MRWAPFNCKLKSDSSDSSGSYWKNGANLGMEETVCECVCVKERYDGKREGKLLTTKYSEREIRVTKRGRGKIIQQLSEGNVIRL